MICHSDRFTYNIFALEILQIVATATRGPPIYTIKDNQEDIIRATFYQKELITVIEQWTRVQ